MKDEIKEILDKLKDNDWYEELDLTGTKWIELKQEETKQILDYITNLQQEIEKLNNDKRGMLVQLYKSNDEKDNYKSKCEKAIEYVKRIQESENNINPYILHAPTLLNILQGSDKDCID